MIKKKLFMINVRCDMDFKISEIFRLRIVRDIAIFFFLAWPNSVRAYDWYVDAKITVVEPDYIPNSIAFQVDQNAGACDAGQFLNYYAQGSVAADKSSNVNAVLSSLITALSTQRTVRIYGNNNGCAVTNIWMLR